MNINFLKIGSYLSSSPDSVSFGSYSGELSYVSIAIGALIALAGFAFYLCPAVHLVLNIFMWMKRKKQKPSLANYRI